MRDLQIVNPEQPAGQQLAAEWDAFIRNLVGLDGVVNRALDDRVLEVTADHLVDRLAGLAGQARVLFDLACELRRRGER